MFVIIVGFPLAVLNLLLTLMLCIFVNVFDCCLLPFTFLFG